MPRIARRSVIGAATALPLVYVNRIARAQTLSLSFSSWLPPKHPIVENAYRPWIRQIEEATSGRVQIRILAQPLGGPPAHFDLVKDGVADLGYSLHSFVPGDRFLLQRVGEFSFLGDDAEALSVAYWRAFKKHLENADEHRGVKLLALYTHGPGNIHTKPKPVREPADMQGLRFRVPGGHASDLVQALGGVPIQAPAGQIYEMLSRGVADGVTITYEAITSFKLTEQVRFTTTLPGGIYNTTWFVVMNRAKWDALADKDKEAIEKLSGEAFARLVGKAWNEADRAAIEQMKAAGIQIFEGSPALAKAVKAASDALEAKWAEQARARGVDGKAVLAEIRAATGVRLPT
ncbi:MAG: TRAP transporter substrate-binding protein [Geminicoccaceae bacterium]|nr:TRAP transporter substrate-binding protein [Geminicoccaceae bacterium]